MAFTVTDDQARQEQVWEALSRAVSREPYQIRGLLTEGAVRASDKRALFVGLEAYEAAGGVVMRDLFLHDDGGWLQDPALLDRLVAETLEAEAATVRAEGLEMGRGGAGLYLSRGRREGRYWRIGDVHNTPGRSLYVRLHGAGAGRWADGATGDHGDLLDLIGLNQGLDRLGDALEEARSFLSLPRIVDAPRRWEPRSPVGSPEAARRLFARSRPIAGTLAEAYLRNRGIPEIPDFGFLRFQPRCWYRTDTDRLAQGPALIAAVTDRESRITGVQRTWLDPSGRGKVAMTAPRRALGSLRDNGVRFSADHDVQAAGEGIETMLALRTALPALPMVAALSAGHLAALRLPPPLRRLYIARDNDATGRGAAERRAEATGIEPRILTPLFGDFNDDLLARGAVALRAHLRTQLAPEDGTRFWLPADG